MRRQEDDNTVMVDAMAEEKAGVERKLEAARAECARLAEEGSSLKKEVLVKTKKAEATSKVSWVGKKSDIMPIILEAKGRGEVIMMARC